MLILSPVLLLILYCMAVPFLSVPGILHVLLNMLHTALLQSSPTRCTVTGSCPAAARNFPNTSSVRIFRLDVQTHG